MKLQTDLIPVKCVVELVLGHVQSGSLHAAQPLGGVPHQQPPHEVPGQPLLRSPHRVSPLQGL